MRHHSEAAFLCYNRIEGGDLASTWVAKLEVHAEHENTRKKTRLNINANDENFAAGDAIAA
jgi:hypothetical protein